MTEEATKSLEASEVRYRRLFESARDGILILDVVSRKVTDANPFMVELLGYSRDEFLGKELWEIGLLKDEEFSKAAFRELEELGYIRYDDLPLETKGGARREIEFVSNVYTEGDRQVVQCNIRDISERKRSAGKLLRSQEQLAGLIDSAMDAVISIDGEQRIVLFNAAAERMFCYPAAEAIGQSLDRFIPERFRTNHSALVQAFGRTDVTKRSIGGLSVILGVRADGEEFPIDASISHRESEGQRLYTVILRDITERKRSEEALRASEERYRSLFESNPLPMWVSDLETLAFLAVNDAAILHYGYSREEFLSKTIKDIRLPEAGPSLLGTVGSGIDDAGIWKHQKKDGGTIDAETASHKLTFAGRRAELVLVHDVTERRRSEETQVRHIAQLALRADVNAALAESDAPLPRTLKRCTEAVVQHLGANFAGVWTLNKGENVLELQASAGINIDAGGPYELVPVGKFKIGLIAESRQPHITNDVQNDPRVSDKAWLMREGLIAFAGYPLSVEDRLVGVIAMFARQHLAKDTLDALSSVADLISQDIERKRAEEALKHSEEQLRQSQKLEAVGQLAGGIAHDFNNLLTVINGYSDLSMKKLQAEDPLRLNLKEIRKAGDRAAALTRQLLAFSRKQVLQPKILDLNAIISELEKMLRRLIGEDIDLRTVCAPDLGSTRADPGQIGQVVMNLAVNARDAMPHGGKLTIETRNVQLTEEYARHHVAVIPGWYVLLAVSDTGSGMDEQTRGRVFEPFFTTKETGQGTGLGLSTVYGIVKQSGGNIWVYTEPGMGTTFKVYLPRVDQGAEEYKQSLEFEEVLMGSETILLAEDEEMVRNLAREILGTYGYKVLEAASGGSALLICEQYEESIDLLLTDVVMPEMSGRKLADRLAGLRPEMKVLYMSGYADNAIVHQGVLEEGTNFIQKPFSPDTLAAKVRDVLDA